MSAAQMGIFQRLRSSPSGRNALLAELADLTGRKESLIERLGRHAAMCAYPNIRSGVEEIAARETAHAKALMGVLADNGLWSRPPERAARDGSNNWQRLSGDLELAVELGRMINRQAVLWQPLDPEISKRFAVMYAEDCDNTSRLRDLALKCDPQAFD